MAGGSTSWTLEVTDHGWMKSHFMDLWGHTSWKLEVTLHGWMKSHFMDGDNTSLMEITLHCWRGVTLYDWKRSRFLDDWAHTSKLYFTRITNSLRPGLLSFGDPMIDLFLTLHGWMRLLFMDEWDHTSWQEASSGNTSWILVVTFYDWRRSHFLAWEIIATGLSANSGTSQYYPPAASSAQTLKYTISTDRHPSGQLLKALELVKFHK